VRDIIRAHRSIFVVYGDGGTGGLLDKVLAEEGVERIQGPHCYAFFSGLDRFAATGGRRRDGVLPHRLSCSPLRQAGEQYVTNQDKKQLRIADLCRIIFE
jgi:hypothetical protein